ncbi:MULTISPECIES: T9SS type A sorting domain-containing protein [unclassified Chryseobacterium]|uniref:T9SS type A sorting domain-containing protein n=1 Tax=unclassified Chryseobacterium TaxID=2593645 RepID=UPI00226A1618|nr:MULTISPECIES: T9SS type A sorting domain-containing protein [unclassified Chryseobacterium]
MKKILLSYLFLIGMITHAQINLGTGSTSAGPQPISNYYSYSYVQQIFSKYEINAVSAGSITGLKFYLNNTLSLTNSSNWAVYVGHTSKGSFDFENSWIPVSQLTQVFSGNVLNNNGVISVNFTTPFFYNNVDNLVVAIKESDPGYDGSAEAFYVYDSAPRSSMYFRSDFTNPNLSSPPSGTPNDTKSVISIEGLSANTTPACPTITFPSDNSEFISINPQISWVAVPGALQYRISVGTTPGGEDIVSQQLTSATNYTPAPTLNINSFYYIKLIAITAAGESAGCSVSKFTTVPLNPTNDECSDAIPLTVNPDLNCGTVTAGYNLGGSDSGITPDPCNGLPDADVWFKFVATESSHVISLRNIQSIGSDYSTDMNFQVFSGNCGNLSSIFCSDSNSSLVPGLTVGETYYMRVYSYWGGDYAQSFNVCVGTMPSPPVNDDCFGAFSVAGFPYSHTELDAAGSTNNNGFITTCTEDHMNDGTWFKFTGNGTNVDIEVLMPNDSLFDPQIGVYSGSCNNLICEGTVDDFEEGGREFISISTVLGNTYYVNVGHFSGFSDAMEDTFTINMLSNVLSTSAMVKKDKAIKVYPNPFTDSITISDVSNVKSLSITDISGRLIKTIDKPSQTLYLEDLKQGMYLITLFKSDGTQVTIKTIKK